MKSRRRAAQIVGLFVLLLTAGCAGMDRAPPGEPPMTEVQQENPVAAKPAQATPNQDRPAVVEPVPSAAASPVTAPMDQSAAKPEAPAAKPADKAPASPAPKNEVAAMPAPKPPPLDLTTLEKRLKETNAIGVFTKLALKNQVDALLEQFRAYYQGRLKTTLAQLRQPYDRLLMKVLSLLQDSDPPLARDIVQSREAIWGILSDKNKFDNL